MRLPRRRLGSGTAEPEHPSCGSETGLCPLSLAAAHLAASESTLVLPLFIPCSKAIEGRGHFLILSSSLLLRLAKEHPCQVEQTGSLLLLFSVKGCFSSSDSGGHSFSLSENTSLLAVVVSWWGLCAFWAFPPTLISLAMLAQGSSPPCRLSHLLSSLDREGRNLVGALERPYHGFCLGFRRAGLTMMLSLQQMGSPGHCIA